MVYIHLGTSMTPLRLAAFYRQSTAGGGHCPFFWSGLIECTL